MSIHIPSEVVFFLNLLGIPYPDVDVDQVRELSQDIRDFAADIRDSFDASTNTLEDMGSSLSGNSYQTILVVWSFRQEKMAELDTAFDVAATAIDISADVIEAIQIAVLIELAALAASFVAGMFTPAGAVTSPVIAAAARWLLKEMAKAVMWYVAAEVTMKALQPLVEKFDQLIRDSLLPPDFTLPSNGPDKTFYIDPPAVSSHIRDLEKQADEMISHGEKFGNRLADLDFSTPGLEVPRADWPYPGADEPLNIPTQPGTLPSVFPSWVPEMMRTLPDWLPEMQKPGIDIPFEKTSDTGSTIPGPPNTGSGTTPATQAPPTAEPHQPNTASPNMPSNVPPTDASVATPTSMGASSPTGADIYEPARSTEEGGSASDSGAGYGADRNETGPMTDSGNTAGVVPPGTAPTTGSTPGQSQAAAAQNNSQRAADTAANKAQGSGGRAPAGSGPSAQQPAGTRIRSTPWSRAGKKPAPVLPATERPDEKVPAISIGETGDRGEAVPKAQSASDGPGSTAPQVFAPNTPEPPARSSTEEETGREAARDIPAESAAKSADTFPVGSRRPSAE
ncbi:hypothetical protein ACFWPH_06595 [Nocardia sp. NPDC058499]|uniref:hypothetical protein n=1 Tax=Nocardia sp. NPDC058499 TaxID=3346530 RepID=UPI003649C79D